jgi:hypothetical protein
MIILMRGHINEYHSGNIDVSIYKKKIYLRYNWDLFPEAQPTEQPNMSLGGGWGYLPHRRLA